MKFKSLYFYKIVNLIIFLKKTKCIEFKHNDFKYGSYLYITDRTQNYFQFFEKSCVFDFLILDEKKIFKIFFSSKIKKFWSIFQKIENNFVLLETVLFLQVFFDYFDSENFDKYCTNLQNVGPQKKQNVNSFNKVSSNIKQQCMLFITRAIKYYFLYSDEFLKFFFENNKILKIRQNIKNNADEILLKPHTLKIHKQMNLSFKVLKTKTSQQNNFVLFLQVFFYKNRNTLLFDFFTGESANKNNYHCCHKNIISVPNKFFEKIDFTDFFFQKKICFDIYFSLESTLSRLLYNYIFKKSLTKTKKFGLVLTTGFFFKKLKNPVTYKTNDLVCNDKDKENKNNILYKILFLFSLSLSLQMHKIYYLHINKIHQIIKEKIFKNFQLFYFCYHLSANRLNSIKYFILRKIVKFAKQNLKTTKYFYFYIMNFLEQYFNEKIFFQIFFQINFSSKWVELVNFLTKKYFSFQIFIGKGFFLNEMLYILLYMFKYKDIFMFKHWLLINLERVFFAKHKIFFYKLKLILKDLFFLMVKHFNVKGFYISVAGKIASAGNSRKKRYIITSGFSGFSSYKYKLQYGKYIARTKAGVLGLTVALSYF